MQKGNKTLSLRHKQNWQNLKRFSGEVEGYREERNEQWLILERMEVSMNNGECGRGWWIGTAKVLGGKVTRSVLWLGRVPSPVFFLFLLLMQSALSLHQSTSKALHKCIPPFQYVLSFSEIKDSSMSLSWCWGRCWIHSSVSNKTSVYSSEITSLRTDLITKCIDSTYYLLSTVIKNFSILTHLIL